MSRTQMMKATAIVAALAVVAAAAVPALAAAYQSGDKVTTTGPNTLAWTGQGTTNGVLDNLRCGPDATGHGVPADGYNYLYWVFTTDGGSATATPGTTPQLTLGGSVIGTFDYTFANDSPTANTFHFVTPYFDPAGLTASVAFNTVETGNGAYILTLSHGCPPRVRYWCSPGFWAQNQGRLAGSAYDPAPYLNDPVPGFPQYTVGYALANPKIVKGPAFNAAANYLSGIFFGANAGTQADGENCPIDAHGNWVG